MLTLALCTPIRNSHPAPGQVARVVWVEDPADPMRSGPSPKRPGSPRRHSIASTTGPIRRFMLTRMKPVMLLDEMGDPASAYGDEFHSQVCVDCCHGMPVYIGGADISSPEPEQNRADGRTARIGRDRAGQGNGYSGRPAWRDDAASRRKPDVRRLKRPGSGKCRPTAPGRQPSLLTDCFRPEAATSRTCRIRRAGGPLACEGVSTSDGELVRSHIRALRSSGMRSTLRW